MADTLVLENVIGPDKLPDLRARLERLDAQRKCMRVPDGSWRAMKSRARKSQRPIVEALQGELNAYAYMVMQAL